MSEHTPGPWELVIGAGSEGYAGNYEVLTAVDGEHEANARLIWAAPDLLAALEWMVNLACGVSKDGSRDITSQEIQDGVDAAIAAIAKAKGEEQ